MKAADRVRPEIRQMRGYVSGEQPATGKCIKLNTNESPFPPPATAVRAIQDAAARQLNVYPDAMANSFRIAAAQQFGLEKDWILCGNGSDDLLTILTRTFVEPGTRIRIPYPSYVLYRTLAEIQGAETEEIHFQADWKLPDAFCEDTANIALAILPNPNSPSGTCLPVSRLRELAGRMDCPLVVDEAYVDFADDHAIPLVKEMENVIVTRTLSKSYGLAGLRFGYAVARPELIAEMQKVKDSYNCDALATAGATAALLDTAWLENNVATIRKLRTRLEEGLVKLGFQTIPSQANFIWCRHRTADSHGLYEYLKQRQILVRYMDYPDWGNGLRISVGTEDQISALLTILNQAIAE